MGNPGLYLWLKIFSISWRHGGSTFFPAVAKPSFRCYSSGMIHENLSQAIEDLSSRMIAIRDSL
jgi:hypothetical protein